jgi:hypothetical protein
MTWFRVPVRSYAPSKKAIMLDSPPPPPAPGVFACPSRDMPLGRAASHANVRNDLLWTSLWKPRLTNRSFLDFGAHPV